MGKINSKDYLPCNSKFVEVFEKKEIFDYKPCVPGVDLAAFCINGQKAYSYWDYIYSMNLSEIVRAVNSNDLMRKAKAYYLETNGGNTAENYNSATEDD